MTSAYETVPSKKLKVFLVEEDREQHEPLYMTILQLLHDAGIAGATVFRGTDGFGERRVIHTDKLELMSFNLPIVIESVDTPEKIDAVAPRVAALLTSGLVEVSRTSILRPAGGRPNASLPEGTEGGTLC